MGLSAILPRSELREDPIASLADLVGVIVVWVVAPEIAESGDGLPDTLDSCPDVQSTDTSDSDFDGISDVCDNCGSDFNPGQEDGDFDGIGDLCDLVIDTDNIPALPSAVVWMTDGFEGGTIY